MKCLSSVSCGIKGSNSLPHGRTHTTHMPATIRGRTVWHGSPHVVYKREAVLMTVVGAVLLAALLPPCGVVWKERVSMLRHIVYLRQAKPVGHGQGLLVDAGPTYYIYIDKL